VIQDFDHGVLTEFAGLPVTDIPGEGYRSETKWPQPPVPDWSGMRVPADVESWAWRVGDPDSRTPDYDEAFAWFLAHVDTTRVRAFIMGNWESGTSAEVYLAGFLEQSDRFPALEALFVGDIDSSQNEVSWIMQTDVTPAFHTFPNLRVFGARGGQDLRIPPFQHARLRELTLQSGGLPPEAVRGVGGSDLPALTDLELYLGTDEYGGGATAEDLAEILSGARLPSLRYLGLRDAENVDELASAIAHAPVVAQLEVLDLSLGNLSDRGAAVLLAGQPLTHLKKLDLHHHFLSAEMRDRLRAALPGVEVNLDSPQEAEGDGDDVWRYIAVSE
jgi:hypothetical protein